MPPETARKLDEIYELTKENNRMLHKMRRAAFWSGVWRFIWVLIVLGVPLILYYYFLQPYVEQVLNAYKGVQSGAQNFQNFTTNLPSGWEEILQKLGIDPSKFKQ